MPTLNIPDNAEPCQAVQHKKKIQESEMWDALQRSGLSGSLRHPHFTSEHLVRVPHLLLIWFPDDACWQAADATSSAWPSLPTWETHAAVVSYLPLGPAWVAAGTGKANQKMELSLSLSFLSIENKGLSKIETNNRITKCDHPYETREAKNIMCVHVYTYIYEKQENIIKWVAIKE